MVSCRDNSSSESDARGTSKRLFTSLELVATRTQSNPASCNFCPDPTGDCLSMRVLEPPPLKDSVGCIYQFVTSRGKKEAQGHERFLLFVTK